jgi:FkbM family methyltransferase
MDELAFHRVLHRPGTLVDVGAHDGAFTLPFARLPASRVLAFEPLPSAFARLRQATAGLTNVELRQEALGDHRGEAVLAVPIVDGAPSEQWASVAKGYAQHGVAEQRFTVPLRRLDDLGLTDLTAVKLDAEGAEQEVLRGARDTLLRCRPILSVEIEERHREGSTWAVPAWLDALGYDGLFTLHGEWRGMAEFHRPTMQRASPDPRIFKASDPYVFTFCFLPREHAAEMLGRLRTAAGVLSP